MYEVLGVFGFLVVFALLLKSFQAFDRWHARKAMREARFLAELEIMKRRREPC